MKDSNEDSRRQVFGTAGVCLHCMVWDLIIAHSPPAPDGSGKKLFDQDVIIGNLVGVMAELIAGVPDRNARRQYLRLIDERLRRGIANNLQDGNHPEPLTMRRQ